MGRIIDFISDTIICGTIKFLYEDVNWISVVIWLNILVGLFEVFYGD